MKSVGNMNLSIIIPNYNSEQTIYRCLNSTIPLINAGAQVIVINDGSQDSSLAYIRSWEKSNEIELINFDDNHGSAMARNAGLKEANRDWVMFLDSDDELIADNVFLTLTNSQPCDEIIVAALEAIDSIDLKRVYTNTPVSRSDTIECYTEFILANRGFSRIIYRNQFLQKNDINFFPTHRDLNGFSFNMDDYFFLLKALFFLAVKPRFVAIPIYRYYLVPGNRKRYQDQCQKFGIGFDLLMDQTILNNKQKLNFSGQREAVLNDAISQYMQCLVELRGTATLRQIPNFLASCRRAKYGIFNMLQKIVKIAFMFLKVNLGLRKFLKSKLFVVKYPNKHGD